MCDYSCCRSCLFKPVSDEKSFFWQILLKLSEILQGGTSGIPLFKFLFNLIFLMIFNFIKFLLNWMMYFKFFYTFLWVF